VISHHRSDIFSATSGSRAPCTSIFAGAAETFFIIQFLSWQVGKPKELDQSFVRVARHTQGTDRGYLAERRENPLLDAVLRSKSLCA